MDGNKSLQKQFKMCNQSVNEDYIQKALNEGYQKWEDDQRAKRNVFYIKLVIAGGTVMLLMAYGPTWLTRLTGGVIPVNKWIPNLPMVFGNAAMNGKTIIDAPILSWISNNKTHYILHYTPEGKSLLINLAHNIALRAMLVAVYLIFGREAYFVIKKFGNNTSEKTKDGLVSLVGLIFDTTARNNTIAGPTPPEDTPTYQQKMPPIPMQNRVGSLPQSSNQVSNRKIIPLPRKIK